MKLRRNPRVNANGAYGIELAHPPLGIGQLPCGPGGLNRWQVCLRMPGPGKLGGWLEQRGCLYITVVVGNIHSATYLPRHL